MGVELWLMWTQFLVLNGTAFGRDTTYLLWSVHWVLLLQKRYRSTMPTVAKQPNVRMMSFFRSIFRRDGPMISNSYTTKHCKMLKNSIISKKSFCGRGKNFNIYCKKLFYYVSCIQKFLSSSIGLIFNLLCFG